MLCIEMLKFLFIKNKHFNHFISYVNHSNADRSIYWFDYLNWIDLEEIHSAMLNKYSKLWNEVKYFIELIHRDKNVFQIKWD